MARHLLTSALIAGVAAGILAALFQLWLVVPLLLEGELYETGARVHFSTGGTPSSDAGAPPVWPHLARHAGTVAMNVVTYTAFAFFLVAGFILARRVGHRVDARKGAVWGLCAFAAVQLAPAAGLPPELPGTIAADLAQRQVWWLGCVVASGSGIALLAFGRGAAMLAAGAGLLALPHLIGAPHIDTHYGTAPAELASHFAARSLAAGALAWVILGSLAGALWSRFEH